ncbi:MAG: glycosyltransferase family 39 protein, partial [Anaerolineae bacterium]|nr:glycosyltransferase family 39 protein [Anaerolineae bacterium]
MSEDHQKSRGVSPIRNDAQTGHGVPMPALMQSGPTPVSQKKDRWLCGPRASCPLCSEGSQVRSGCCEQTGDDSREDAGETPGIRVPTVRERAPSARPSLCRDEAQIGHGVPAPTTPVSQKKDRWLCGPRASCPLCSEGSQVRRGCCEQTGDDSRVDAGEMPGIRVPTVRERASSPRLFLWLKRTLLLLLAFAVRVSTLQAQGLWRDEVDQWRFAFQSPDELAANFTRPGWNGPLYSPILRGWIALSGESVFAMRLLSVIWGVLTVSLVIVLAQRIIRDRRTAEVAGVLVAFSPYLIWYAQEIKMYTWVPMLAVMALYALDRACRQPRFVWWAVVLVATTLAVYSHILAALLIPVLVIWFVVHPARGPRVWGGGLLVLAGLTLPYLPLLGWQAPLLLIDRQTGYPSYSLGQMSSALLNGWSLGISQGAWGTPSVTLVAMIAL